MVYFRHDNNKLKLYSFSLWEEQRLRLSANKVLMEILRQEIAEVTTDSKNYIMKFYNLNSSLNTVRVFKL